MNTFTMIVCIVGIVMLAHVIERTLKYRAEQDKRASLDEDASQRFNELEDRIRVLERIVTEHKFDLKKEIDRL